VVGFTFTQLIVHAPIVLIMLWALAATLEYKPPVMP
jgi:short-chain fatty acids transporter